MSGRPIIASTQGFERDVTRWILRGYTVLAFTFLLLPIAIIVLMSFSNQRYMGFPPPGWTLHWYEAVREQPRWLTATINSFCIGIPTALLAIVFGTLAALGIARGDVRFRKFLLLLMMAPMMLPHVIIAIGLYPTLVDMRLQDSYIAVIIGHTVIGVPLVFITVTASLRSYPASLDLAARTLGAGTWQAFRRVTLPMIWVGIVSGGLLAFATSFDELMLALFLTSPGTETLPRLIWDQLSFALSPTLAAVATLILVLSVLLQGFAVYLGARRSALKRAQP
ncbi:MAG TPA: ABC transporter permease [Acetobacteraceae bacterium]|jgi:ABC-type spermidine/putrescine transport system permease subunit II|nr:ABC transporter permease [Acetobacteraceae bacterium]